MGSTEEKTMREKEPPEETSQSMRTNEEEKLSQNDPLIEGEKPVGVKKKIVKTTNPSPDWAELAKVNKKNPDSNETLPQENFPNPYYAPQMMPSDPMPWGQATYAAQGTTATPYYYPQEASYPFNAYMGAAGPSYEAYRPPMQYQQVQHPLQRPYREQSNPPRKSDSWKGKKFDKPTAKSGEKTTMACKYYEKSGFCENGCLCTFSHDLASPMTQQALKLNLDFLIGQQKLIIRNLAALDKKMNKTVKKQSEIIESLQSLDDRFRDIGLSKTNMTKRDNRDAPREKERRRRSRSASGGERVRINDRLNKLEKRQQD